MFPFVLIIIILACLLVIAYIHLKNLPKVKSVNSQAAPVVQQLQVKRKLLEERLGRRLKGGFSKSLVILKPLAKLAVNKFRVWFNHLTELEEKYRHQALKSNLKEKDDKQQASNKMLSEAEALVKLEKFSEAEKKYIEILQFDDKNMSAYKGLGELYLEQKEYKQAKETFEYLLNLNDKDPLVYKSLGEIASQKGDLKKAQEEYHKSLELDSADISSYLDLAEVYINLEEPEKAFEIVSKAASLEPNNPKVLDFLIEVSIIVRDKGAALKAFSQLKEVNPENQKLKEIKEQIDKL